MNVRQCVIDKVISIYVVMLRFIYLNMDVAVFL